MVMPKQTADPDQIAPSDLGLHCLPKLFQNHLSGKVDVLEFKGGV